MTKARIIEFDSEHGSLYIEVKYEYDPGFRGSQDEPPEVDQVSILDVRIISKGEEYVSFITTLKDDIQDYEREGGGIYNPADDR